MSGIKRDLLAYADFLKESGFLYVESGSGERQTGQGHADSAEAAAAAGPEGRIRDTGEKVSHSPEGSSDRDQQQDGKDQPPLNRKKLEAAARERVAACVACPLSRKRTQTVYGTGSLNSRIVFVGEAPGAEEDRTGVPFVGRAGQLLTKMIEAIGFRRDEVYICNTVKCRPPDNRDPTPDEKAACRPFLEEQLQILRPQILVGLGAHAAGYLTGLQTSLGKMRRQWHEFEGIPTMVTYHPAFLLRSPGMKKQAWEDLQMLAARYSELNPDDAREVWKRES